jgi:hypothetical protein
MKRSQLEHVIRAAAAIVDLPEIVVIGSQSILGALPDAPEELLRSMELDVYPLRDPARADLIEGGIGEGSPFGATFGYYAHGVGPETAKLPAGWEARLVRVQNANTDQKIGYCLEPHDMAASKLVAAREKDKPFVAAMLRHGLISGQVLAERIATLALEPERRERLRSWLSAELARARAGEPSR